MSPQPGSATVRIRPARTDYAFIRVAEGARKSGDRVHAIAAASSDQAQGGEQVNRALADMDRGARSDRLIIKMRPRRLRKSVQETNWFAFALSRAL